MAKATITRAEATITLELTEHEAEVMLAIYAKDVEPDAPTRSVYMALAKLDISKALVAKYTAQHGQPKLTLVTYD